MREVLVVSAYLPQRLEDSSGGFHRLDAFMASLCGYFDTVKVLYFDHHDPSFSGHRSVADYEAVWRARWGQNIRVTMVRRAAPSSQHWLIRWFLGIFHIRAQGGYASLTTPDQISAVRSNIGAHTRMVFAHRLSGLLPVMCLNTVGAPVVFDLDDLEHLALFRRSVARPYSWRQIIYAAHYFSLALTLRRFVGRTAATFVCSDVDRIKLQASFGAANVVAVPNTVPDVSAIAVPSTEKLLFVGNFGHPPNCSGIEWFLENVFGRIREKRPTVRCIVAGAKSDLVRVPSACQSAVDVRGFIPDLSTVYAEAAVVICPIQTGSGTRVKLVEAAMYGVAIVSTRLGAEGLLLRDSTELLIADDAESFATACLSLLHDPKKAAALGHAARTAAVGRYSREAVLDQLAQIFSRLS